MLYSVKDPNMNTSRKLLTLFALFIIAGCSAVVRQDVTPFTHNTEEVCIIVNPNVAMEGFLITYVEELKNKGYSVKTLMPDAKLDECEVTSTYAANWKWDLALYMSNARLDVYLNGIKEAEARYSIVKEGASGKFIHADEKIKELVNILYPTL